ncbi:hypothetical protein ABW21_db0201816 [Orbilia brochopaga]|nr:hypothetical protein ABW21_db0201816 [Drechslerella brochopaga]
MFGRKKEPKTGPYWVYRIAPPTDRGIIPRFVVMEFGGFPVETTEEYVDVVIPKKWAGDFQELFPGCRLLRTDYGEFPERTWRELLCWCF